MENENSTGHQLCFYFLLLFFAPYVILLTTLTHKYISKDKHFRRHVLKSSVV